MGGVETVRADFVEPARQRGWRVAVTLTPCAARWLAHTGELQALERATGLPVRSQPRMPGERSPHPPVDCYVVSPASANTVAKLALGIADNQALTTACEAIGGGAVPVIVFPRVNAAHARQPSGTSIWPHCVRRACRCTNPARSAPVLAGCEFAVSRQRSNSVASAGVVSASPSSNGWASWSYEFGLSDPAANINGGDGMG